MRVADPRPETRDPRHAARDLAVGVGVWTGFCLVAVALRGVRWDENFEFAQVIGRTIAYPEGHPLFRYVRGMFSLQTYSLAALLCVTRDPVVLCGLRNTLFLLATVAPAFLLGALLSRRALVGHIAAAVVLLGTHVAFYSTYPQFVWPHMYSNGHIGTGYALLTVYCLAAGHWRAGAFLVGLMPCVHLGQWPPVLGLAGLMAAWTWRRDAGRALRYVLPWAAAGLAVSAAVYGIVRLFAVPDPTSGPYFSATDPHAVWLGYMARHASHRSIPWGTGHIALAAWPFLALGAARREAREDRAGGPWCWLLAYGVCVAGIVWGIMAVHMLVGPKMPFLLVAWMPYRLMNHVPPLLVIGSVALLAAGRDRRAPAALIVAAVCAYGVAKPGLRALAGDDVYARYLETGIGAVFVLYGAAVAVVGRELKDDQLFFVPWVAVGLIGWVLLVFVHRFGAACAATGLAAAWALEGPLDRGAQRLKPGWTVAGLAVALVAALTYGQWVGRDHLPVSAFEHRVAAYLAGQGEPDALIVADYQQEGLQARTGHPIMADMATITWIAYKPSLGPTMDKLYGDVWGLHFAPRPSPEPAKAWFEHWAERDRGAWQALGETYGFRYVVAPNFVAPDLRCVVEGDTQSLYEIPSRAAES